jgi:hypothetical protein
MAMKISEAPKKSYNRIIIDFFINKNAINCSNSIKYEDINIPISDKEKRFLLNNFIKDEFIVMKANESLWFDKRKWDKAVNSLTRTYLMILIVPIIIATILFLIINKLM